MRAVVLETGFSICDKVWGGAGSVLRGRDLDWMQARRQCEEDDDDEDGDGADI